MSIISRFDLTGSVAIVTGGGRGIGRAIALAYAEAGADVLYAPGPKTTADIAAIVKAAGGKPVNTLIYGDFGLTVADIAATGTRRISIGGALARAAWAAFIEATRLIAEEGSFKGFAGNGPSAPLNPFFTKDLAERS